MAHSRSSHLGNHTNYCSALEAVRLQNPTVHSVLCEYYKKSVHTKKIYCVSCSSKVLDYECLHSVKIKMKIVKRLLIKNSTGY
jgi:hypothetical protein